MTAAIRMLRSLASRLLLRYRLLGYFCRIHKLRGLARISKCSLGHAPSGSRRSGTLVRFSFSVDSQNKLPSSRAKRVIWVLACVAAACRCYQKPRSLASLGMTSWERCASLAKPGCPISRVSCKKWDSLKPDCQSPKPTSRGPTSAPPPADPPLHRWRVSPLCRWLPK